MSFPDGDALIPESFDEHIANGPLAEQTDQRMRGISVYAVPVAEALELANGDPMVRAGRLAIEGSRWWTAAGTARFGRG